jgi:hypothetical protein
MAVQVGAIDGVGSESRVEQFGRRLAELISTENRSRKNRVWTSDAAFDRGIRTCSTRSLIHPSGQ